MSVVGWPSLGLSVRLSWYSVFDAVVCDDCDECTVVLCLQCMDAERV